uniref:Uncharacterized protein n=1 Tax=Arundo donax TaxID=35708 RepID=A0A0A8Y5I7_ARUDO
MGCFCFISHIQDIPQIASLYCLIEVSNHMRS